MADPGSVTGLLLAWGKGDEVAFQQLVPLVERELHRIAKRCMAGERVGHSLQATALVNEAYLRLIDAQQVKWQDRAHFLAMSARLMRRILVDWARSKQYQKRGGGALRVTFDEALPVGDERGEDLVALDEALQELAKFDERKSKVIELRFFGGAERRGNGVGSERLCRYRHARLEARKGVAIARNAWRRLSKGAH